MWWLHSHCEKPAHGRSQTTLEDRPGQPQLPVGHAALLGGGAAQLQPPSRTQGSPLAGREDLAWALQKRDLAQPQTPSSTSYSARRVAAPTSPGQPSSHLHPVPTGASSSPCPGRTPEGLLSWACQGRENTGASCPTACGVRHPHQAKPQSSESPGQWMCFWASAPGSLRPDVPLGRTLSTEPGGQRH